MTTDVQDLMHLEPGTTPTGERYLNEEQKDRARRLWNEMWEAGQRGEDLEPYAEALCDLAAEGRRMNGPKDEQAGP